MWDMVQVWPGLLDAKLSFHFTLLTVSKHPLYSALPIEQAQCCGHLVKQQCFPLSFLKNDNSSKADQANIQMVLSDWIYCTWNALK